MGIIETEKMLNIEQGIKIGNENFVKKLISKLDFTDKQAADFAEVPLTFVKKIRSQLKKGIN
ncbi:hypothetical protein [Pedobacter sp.]|jgi:hypothetical protein|uniref:hypothetical protein n=1 Tax=Pedobacter sp. TaxID=1411316 RepID=UPI002C2C10A7|nr:hypothetical protein [Pedobacter sp.]HWW42023.1 hypothetical protein [Pedobacter sp.]